MYIGNEQKAIQVERIGGPAQPKKVSTPTPIPVMAEKVTVTEKVLVAS